VPRWARRRSLRREIPRHRGINTFVFTSFFAPAPNGALYADNLGPPAFEPFEQIVSVTDRPTDSRIDYPARRRVLEPPAGEGHFLFSNGQQRSYSSKTV
jgi:hypothetical protein